MLNHVALLRGINVGGKNTLPMKDLAVLFTDAGCTDVQTYIQSGNVLFNIPPESAERLPQILAASIAERFGLRIPVVLRTMAQFREAAASNPLLASGTPVETLHVLFLASLPRPDQIASLDPHRSKPDAFVVQGREVYLHLPDGIARTKLTNAYFDAKLGTVSTVRNWNTVTKLLELTGQNPIPRKL